MVQSTGTHDRISGQISIVSDQRAATRSYGMPLPDARYGLPTRASQFKDRVRRLSTYPNNCRRRHMLQKVHTLLSLSLELIL